jgi:hypothetical protein
MKALSARRLAMVVVGVLGMLACSEAPAPEAPTELSVKVGEEVTVTLRTLGPGRFEDPVISSAAVRLIESSVLPAQETESMRQLYRFKALGQGRAELLFHHTVLPARTVIIDVSP